MKFAINANKPNKHVDIPQASQTLYLTHKQENSEKLFIKFA